MRSKMNNNNKKKQKTPVQINKKTNKNQVPQHQTQLNHNNHQHNKNQLPKTQPLYNNKKSNNYSEELDSISSHLSSKLSATSANQNANSL